jgi:hypothetical protein
MKMMMAVALDQIITQILLVVEAVHKVEMMIWIK